MKNILKTFCLPSICSRGLFVAIVISVIELSMSSLHAGERKHTKEVLDSKLISSQKGISVSDRHLEKLLKLSEREGLKERKSYAHQNGATTKRYTQMYKGVPVIGDDIIITRHKDGSLKHAHGYVVHGIANDLGDVTPRITPRQAIEIAKNANADKEKRPLPLNPLDYQDETSLLGVWKDDSGKVKLVYQVSFMQYGQEPSKPYYLIDANTKEILKYFDSLQHYDGKGPGGNEKTGKYTYGTNKRPYLDVTQVGDTCIMENANVKTIDMKNGYKWNITDSDSGHSFTCPNNTYKEVNGAYSPINDAHYHGTVTINMYKDWFSIYPLPKKLSIGVHYSNNYANSFFNEGAIFLGDGDSQYYPFVVLDVVSHEIAHGFTNEHVGTYLGHYGPIMSVLNESFSDMAGQAAKYYHDGSNDWQTGAEIHRDDRATRYMNNPPLDGFSIDNQADYTYFRPYHNSAGIFNKAFYLLATTPGWDTKKAFEVYLRANMLYWSASIDWNAAGDAVMDATCDLGYNIYAVQTSLAQVGVISNVSPNSVCLHPSARPTGPNGAIFDVDTDGLMEIYTAEDLNNMRYNLAGTRWKTSVSDVGSAVGCPVSGCNGYELVTNIDFINTRWGYSTGSAFKDTKALGGWEPVGSSESPFTARFEGKGFEIRNLYINRLSIFGVGLFGYIGSGATLNQVALSSVMVKGPSYTGGLVGYQGTNSSISNSYVTGIVTGSTSTGGLVGVQNGSINNSYVKAFVTSDSYNTGGLVGVQNGSINNSYAIGTVANESSNAGGLVGSQNGSISNSYATGSVTGVNQIGGLVGYQATNSSISNSYASVVVTGTQGTGGLVGYQSPSSSIDSSFATGSVTSNGGAGGLVGICNGTISNTYATGSVTNSLDKDKEAYDMGGLAGSQFNGMISNSYATGSVIGAYYTGGLIGSQYNGTISNTYARGSVTGNHYTGGLVGNQSYGTISSSYATGAVTGKDVYIGGFLGGQYYGSVSNSYWDTQSTGQATSFGIGSLGGLTTSQMRLLSTLGPCFKLAYVRYPQLYTSPCTTQILLGGPNTN